MNLLIATHLKQKKTKDYKLLLVTKELCLAQANFEGINGQK